MSLDSNYKCPDKRPVTGPFGDYDGKVKLYPLNSQPPNMVVFNYWEGSEPDWMSNYGKGPAGLWTHYYPECRHILYNKLLARKYIEQNFSGEVVDMYDSFRDNLPAARSDFFRVAYCYKEGGTYIDRRFVPDRRHYTQSMQKKWVNVGIFCEKGDYKCLLTTRPNGAIWNGFICTDPGSETITKIWEVLQHNVKNKLFSNNVWLATGPGAFSRTIEKNVPSDTKIIEWDLFRNYLIPLELVKPGTAKNKIRGITAKGIRKHVDFHHWSKSQETGIYN